MARLGSEKINSGRAAVIRAAKMNSATRGDVTLTEDPEETGTVWTFTAHDATEFSRYLTYPAWQSDGYVYHIINKEFNQCIISKFNYSTNTNAQTMHPVLTSQNTDLLAIRTTNIVSSTNSYWYGMDEGTLSGAMNYPQFVWKLEPATTTAINNILQENNGNNHDAYDLQGRRVNLEAAPSGIYLAPIKKHDGTTIMQTILKK